MTKRERAIKDRLWLKIRKFAITKSLEEKLAQSDLTIEKQEWCCFVMNLVAVGTRDQHQAQILSTTFKHKIGKGYKKIINRLKEWNELEVDEMYTLPTGFRAGEARIYRIPTSARKSGFIVKDFKVGKVKATKDDSTWQEHEPWVGYIHECMNQLSAAEELATVATPEVDALCHDAAKRVFHKDWHCRRGKKSKRLYHTIIEMPKEARANLVWRDTNEHLMGEFDIKSCHPVLVLTMATDATEAGLYRKVLDYDIYDFIRISQGIKDTRLGCKCEWMDFVNHPSTNEKTFKTNYVFQFYKKSFPKLTEAIVSRADMALHLQNLEAAIMVDAVGAFCMKSGIWYVPQHDGWLCKDDDLPTIKDFVVDGFYKKTGYHVKIEFKPFISNGICNNNTSSNIHHMLGYKAPENNPLWLNALAEYKNRFSQEELAAEYKKRETARYNGKNWKRLMAKNESERVDLIKHLRNKPHLLAQI